MVTASKDGADVAGQRSVALAMRSLSVTAHGRRVLWWCEVWDGELWRSRRRDSTQCGRWAFRRDEMLGCRLETKKRLTTSQVVCCVKSLRRVACERIDGCTRNGRISLAVSCDEAVTTAAA
jgi:hypothetical protein